MYRRIVLFCLFNLFLLPFTAQNVSSLLIIQNAGQYPAEVRYVALTDSGSLWLTENALWLTQSASSAPLKITFPGANLHPRLQAFDIRTTLISYYQGKDPAQWHERTPVFGRVQYTGLLPGVDLKMTGQRGQLVLQTSAPLTMEISGGEAAPHSFTLQPGISTPLEQIISPTYERRLSSSKSASDIQPDGSPLLYGTFLGSDGKDDAQAIAADNLGRIYLAGQMLPLPPPLIPAAQPFHAVEAFIARFTPDGSDVEYLTIILGDVEDWGKALAVNDAYEAFFTGETDSANFPTTPGAYDTDENGSFDAFLMKIGADGLIVYSTLLGEADWDTALAVAVDDQGNAYLTGDTWSPDFPTTADAFDDVLDGPRDLFIAKFNPDGSQLLYSTFLGGGNIERGEAIALAAPNVVHITGWTSSADFPTTPNAYDTTYNNAVDAFALQLTLGNSTLTYGTFLGGSGADRGYSLVLDEAGHVFIAGETASINFPATPDAYDTTYAGGPPACDGLPCPDAFAARLSTDGQTLDYATFLGETEWEQANGIQTAPDGNVYLIGEVNSSDFPTSPDAFDDTLSGGRDAFLTVFNSTFANVVYSTFLGGSAYDVGFSLWLGQNGGILIGGSTLSEDFPVTGGAYDTTINGDYDGFAVLLSLPLDPYLTPTPNVTATATPTPTGTLPTPTPSLTPSLTPTPTVTPEPEWDVFIPFVNR